MLASQIRDILPKAHLNAVVTCRGSLCFKTNQNAIFSRLWGTTNSFYRIHERLLKEGREGWAEGDLGSTFNIVRMALWVRLHLGEEENVEIAIAWMKVGHFVYYAPAALIALLWLVRGREKAKTSRPEHELYRKYWGYSQEFTTT